ncbi:SseB family protein [Pseudoglutamicibacter albus]|uniref:SseB protein N-terminal domain-containing protein n=1 Tax=Pseudoglutamicibacter albus TaxID=98671 RepID=A0ABU1Z0Y1_9MICC|nr:SseB family protein [Pseudoglutamicibacter albus]MDR7294273.1 hypothetical protein [Pseudoglutamicibacter albus]
MSTHEPDSHENQQPEQVEQPEQLDQVTPAEQPVQQEEAEHAEEAAQTEESVPAEAAAHVEDVEPVEDAGLAEDTGLAKDEEPAEQLEDTESAEQAEQFQGDEHADETEAAEPEDGERVLDASELEPFNDIERVILEGSEGKLASNEVLSKIAAANLFFLTEEEVTDEQQEVQPLLLQGPDEKTVLAVFTHPARVAQQFVDMAPYAVRMPGLQAFQQAVGVGIAINPGHPIGLVLDAESVENIREVLNS